MSETAQQIKGPLEIYILILIDLRRRYGYEVTKNLIENTKILKTGAGAGTLYPLLGRMQKSKWLKDEWEKVGKKRKRHYYVITKLGRERLKTQLAIFDGIVDDMTKVRKLK